MPLAYLRQTLPGTLDAAAKRELNVFMRLHSTNRAFIQLDDLKVDQLVPFAPAVFLALETSPGNFQAWVALAGIQDRDFARQLYKSTGADATASGATPIAGSLNFEDKYAPDFPHIALHQTNPGHLVTVTELDHLGLIAAQDPEPTVRPLPAPVLAPACANGRATNAVSNVRCRARARPAKTVTASRISAGV